MPEKIIPGNRFYASIPSQIWEKELNVDFVSFVKKTMFFNFKKVLVLVFLFSQLRSYRNVF